MQQKGKLRLMRVETHFQLSQYWGRGEPSPGLPGLRALGPPMEGEHRLQSLEPTEQRAQPLTSPFPPEDAAVKGRLVECLETVLNKAQEPPKSKKVQHSNAKNAILFEAISLIIHYDRCCGQSGGCWGPGLREGG